MKLSYLMCVSALAISTWASDALAAQYAPEATAADNATLGEIVVTARRRSESLQEVPQVVNAVTSDQLDKLQIKQFQDLTRVVPGLEFRSNIGGYSNDVAMRGVSFDSNSSALPSVALYLDDVTIQPNFLFNVMFDIGQVEVLRGPQGTNRGVSAPSGAITVTTRRADLSQFGGYIDVTATDLQARNLIGAVNVPIIRDVLGVRLSGTIDNSDFNGYRSIYNHQRPVSQQTGIRAVVSYEPSDAFNANLVLQHLDKVLENFVPVTGAGFAGNPAAGLAATPPIGLLDRVGVQDRPNTTRFHLNSASLRVDSRLFGQHLSYIGGYSHLKYNNTEDRDTGQNLVGPTFDNPGRPTLEATSHEIRLSSDPAPGRFFDYTAGAYYAWSATSGSAGSVATFLPGAFGSAFGPPNVAAFDPRFQIPIFIPTPLIREEYSVFASTTFHLGSKTELTTGLRHLWARSPNDLKVTLQDGLAGGGLPCAFIPGSVAGTIPGTCVIRSGGTVVAAPPQRYFHEEHTIYTVSLSHHLTSDLLVYGNVGTSFRPGYASVGAVNGLNDPTIAGLQVHPSEKARAYEVGFKWTFMERRGRLNFALFRQKFQNLPLRLAAVNYVACNTPVLSACTVQQFEFTADPSAIVEGFDVDAAFQITPNWSISGQLAYADGRATSDIPCNDSNFDGEPDGGTATLAAFISRGIFIAQCPGGSVSRQPYWSATAQSEYVHPVSDGIDVYLRGLMSYFPKNTHATPSLVIDNYSLVNLYAGVRAHDGAWDVGLFVRNAFNTEEVTDLGVSTLNNFNSTLGGFPSLVHDSGYRLKSLTPRREVGVNVRYAFGSR